MDDEGDHGRQRKSALDAILDETRAARAEMRSGVQRIEERLAKGDTRLALIEERNSNQGALIASLTTRLDAAEKLARALSCEDCDDRIETLENWRRDTVAATDALEKARGWQPSWWIMMVLGAVSGVLTAIATHFLGAT